MERINEEVRIVWQRKRKLGTSGGASRTKRQKVGALLKGGASSKVACDWVGLCVHGEEHGSQPAHWFEWNRV